LQAEADARDSANGRADAGHTACRGGRGACGRRTRRRAASCRRAGRWRPVQGTRDYGTYGDVELVVPPVRRGQWSIDTTDMFDGRKHVAVDRPRFQPRRSVSAAGTRCGEPDRGCSPGQALGAVPGAVPGAGLVFGLGGDVRPRREAPAGGELTLFAGCRPSRSDLLSLCRSSPVGDVPA